MDAIATLAPDDFEYLCRALLCKLGFQNILWRKGGRDRGRDIVAEFARPEPDGRIVLERWFIECKHHSRANPVSVQHLQTKVAWAEAEGADYLLVITSSYLTSDAKDWLEQLEAKKSFRIRYWEESHLTELLNRHPDILRVYFGRRTHQHSSRSELADRAIAARIRELQKDVKRDKSIELLHHQLHVGCVNNLPLKCIRARKRLPYTGIRDSLGGRGGIKILPGHITFDGHGLVFSTTSQSCQGHQKQASTSHRKSHLPYIKHEQRAP